ncbi:hypothetical protein DFH08DRAFT_803536 [Mycena albidolilacea]|uniref:Uncharacterized protein n=1 Tax=Mycena albidolilacea TaxID=1033008 RepID=A0AAD7AD83_9AGAR|nr:hypothetical protein DFH08DRAFT_803536 [Mycena albidolilacea]
MSLHYSSHPVRKSGNGLASRSEGSLPSTCYLGAEPFAHIAFLLGSLNGWTACLPRIECRRYLEPGIITATAVPLTLICARDDDPLTLNGVLAVLEVMSESLDHVAALADLSGDISERLEQLGRDQALHLEIRNQTRKIRDNIARYKAGMI